MKEHPPSTYLMYLRGLHIGQLNHLILDVSRLSVTNCCISQNGFALKSNLA